MPILNIGQQIYIDCGTGTTADNMYIVQSVSHDISAGKFSTSADLTYAGRASYTNIKEQLGKALGKKQLSPKDIGKVVEAANVALKAI